MILTPLFVIFFDFAEWLKLAANALKNQQYQQDYLATGGASVRGFGVPPAAVYL